MNYEIGSIRLRILGDRHVLIPLRNQHLAPTGGPSLVYGAFSDVIVGGVGHLGLIQIILNLQLLLGRPGSNLTAYSLWVTTGNWRLVSAESQHHVLCLSMNSQLVGLLSVLIQNWIELI